MKPSIIVPPDSLCIASNNTQSAPDLVELYYLDLQEQGFDCDLEMALPFLDKDEQDRYRGFKHEPSRNCFLQARRIAKTVLAQKLACSPVEISFDYSETGKPSVVVPKGTETGTPIHFSISHSKSAVAVAVSIQPIGVDTEEVGRFSKNWHHAADYLNEHVKTQVDACASDRDAAATFALHWSCMESYVKLLGSAIFKEKDHVKVETLDRIGQAAYHSYLDAYFVTLELFGHSRLAVASYAQPATIKVITWSSPA